MMKSKYWAYLVIVFLSTLSSCEKDEVAFKAEGSYQSDSLYLFDAPCMIVKNKVISDWDLISIYLHKHHVFNLDPDYDFPPPASFTINFLDSVNVTEVGTATHNWLIEKQTSDAIVLTDPDTVNSSAYGQTSCTLLLDSLNKYSYDQICFYASSSQNICKTIAKNPLLIKNGNLYKPFLDCCISSHVLNYQCTYSETGMTGIVNPNILNLVTEGDTVVIRERRQKLNKI